MNDAVITLNGLEKRFPGMDKPAVAPLSTVFSKAHKRVPVTPVM